jgi:DNA polymerase II large subunit
MEAEVPVDAPVDVTAAIEVESVEVEVQNVDVDDAIIVELSNKVLNYKQ